ncbi:MAG: CoA-binding protein [Bacteroidetes bacterium]|nr:CoA-binding protein [Bacteroidota bacterium]
MDPNSSTDPAAQASADPAAQASGAPAVKKTLVLGATENPSRYAYLATDRLLQHDHPVVLIGARPGQVLGQTILTNHPDLEGIHTVTLYLNPQLQAEYEDYIGALKPTRVIFNPGTENPDFMDRLEAEGVEVLEACTLVMLGAGMY